MRKVLYTILVTLLCITLCVNFVRFIVFSSSSSNGTFYELDVFTIIESLSNFTYGTEDLYKNWLSSFDYLGITGKAFIAGINGSANPKGLVIDKILGFISSLFSVLVGFVMFIVHITQACIDTVIWVAGFIRAIYKLLNTLLGTSFGLRVTNNAVFRLVT